ncbi:hypothetical protein FS837_008986 [Tulasnella sp. UAMH 9824]|nr:hypothetical protein FS837_008986 [Tulasnella sp. UAMH 9824]
MQSSRRAELQAKKEKIEELRRLKKAREDAKLAAATAATSPPPTRSRREVDDILDEVLGRGAAGSRLSDSGLGEATPPTASRPESPAVSGLPLPPIGRSALSGSRSSDVGSDIATPVENTGSQLRFVVDFVDVEQELFELPQKQRVIYNKEVQTAEVETEPTGPSEDEIRQRLLEEQEAERERIRQEKEFEEQSRQLDKEIEEELRDLTEEERASIFVAPEFLDFVETSSKIVERALSDAYDYIRDYTIGAEVGTDDSEGNRVKKVCTFYDEQVNKNRSITDVDWSPKYPELSVASYNKNPAALNEPDGIVAVWNLHMLERPEFVFHSQSDVLSVAFSPFHPNLVFGGSYSGQILLWDTRSKHLPVLKTPLSASGHTHPVYTMQMVGTQNAHNLITGSTDGMVCSWLVDMLAQPQETLDLVHSGHNKTDEVSVTALDFPDNETTTFWVGTEEGNVYQANRYDRAGSKAGLHQHDSYRGHAGPVTGLSFHPAAGPVDFSDLFLTCSVDWTVKLWRTRSAAKPSTSATTITPLYSFEEADDYVYDVRWHPTHPALFGAADGSGRFDLWNLNVDTEVPMVSSVIGDGRAINKFAWECKEGRRVGLGSSDGKLYIYDIGDIANSKESDWVDLQRSLGAMAGGTGQGTATESDAKR